MTLHICIVDEFSFLKAVTSVVIISPSIEYLLAPDDNMSGAILMYLNKTQLVVYYQCCILIG